jgi:hypothetical protein
MPINRPNHISIFHIKNLFSLSLTFAVKCNSEKKKKKEEEEEEREIYI